MSILLNFLNNDNIKNRESKNSLNKRDRKKNMKDKILDSLKSAYPKGGQGLYFELALFLVLGFLIGVAVKTEAAKIITIGFNDYRIAPLTQDYDFNEIQKKLIEEQKAAEEKAESVESAPEGGSCSD